MKSTTRIFRARWLLWQGDLTTVNLRCTHQQLRRVVYELRGKGIAIGRNGSGGYTCDKATRDHIKWLIRGETAKREINENINYMRKLWN